MTSSFFKVKVISSAAQIDDLLPGVYVLVLTVKSTENDHGYYRWITHINIP
jgi:hypothetical protein